MVQIGVNDIYSVYSVAKKLNVSRTKINSVIEQLLECGCENIICEVQKDENKKGQFASSFYITENGLKQIEIWINEDNIVLPSQKPSKAPTSDFNTDSLIETLQEQLKAKDEQIQALNEQLQSKDNIINSLLEQSKNFQVLLQGQQMLSLPEKKRPFFKRLFSRNDDE